MFKLNVTSKSTRMSAEEYNKLIDLSKNGLEIYPKDELTPVPWGADYSIEDDKFILKGGASDMWNKGKCTLEIPLNDVDRMFELSVSPYKDEQADELKELLEKHNLL